MTKIQDCLQYSTESEFSLEELENLENELISYNKRATIYYKTVADLEDQTPIDFKCFEKDISFDLALFENALNHSTSEANNSNPTTPTVITDKTIVIEDSHHVTTVFKKPYFAIFEIFNAIKKICDILISTIIRISPENSNKK